MPEGDRGEVETGARRVHHPGEADECEVAAQDLVRPRVCELLE